MGPPLCWQHWTRPAGPDNSDNRVVGALAVWREVPEWGETAPEPPPGNEPVPAEEARDRLTLLLGENAESRDGQRDYAVATAEAFAPRPAANSPNIVLAEAGTGTGKTLGYIAPASIWAEKNAEPVWISTYTRNLQQQIDQELSRLYPDPDEKARHVVIRKGRENYLCLLNLEDAAGRFTTLQRRNALGVALTARWVQATRDGDLGGDFPAWLVDLVGVPATLGLSDRRGECIYSACSHYNRCFVEHSVRKARKARLVVANHALVMIQAALGGGDDANVPSRYVFDEGHHIFDAADSAFSAHLSGREMAELRRWLLGNEGSGRRRPGGRSRGLRERAEDLIAADDTDAADALAAAPGRRSDPARTRLAQSFVRCDDRRPGGVLPGRSTRAGVLRAPSRATAPILSKPKCAPHPTACPTRRPHCASIWFPSPRPCASCAHV